MKSSIAILAGLSAYAVEAVHLTNIVFDNLSAGGSFPIEWEDATGPVSLELRNGEKGDLMMVEPIVAGVQSNPDGTGSYPWSLPSTLSGEGPYVIVIKDSSPDPNYSVAFPIAGVEVSGTDTSPSSDVVSMAATTLAVQSSSSAEETSSVEPASSAEETTSIKVETTTSVSLANSSSAVRTVTSSSHSSSPTKPGSDDEDGSPSVPDGKAPGLASPLALILVSVAAMFYLH